MLGARIRVHKAGIRGRHAGQVLLASSSVSFFVGARLLRRLFGFGKIAGRLFCDLSCDFDMPNYEIITLFPKLNVACKDGNSGASEL